MHVNLKNMLLSHITQFLSGDIEAKREALKHFALIFFIFMLFFGMFLTPFIIVKENFVTPKQWMDNLVSDK